MLIPVRCFTCGKTVSDKWIPFIKGVNERKDSNITNDVKDLGILEYTDLAVHDNWPTHLNYWIKEELIKVENFALGGLLHLGRYAPFREIHNEY